MFAYIDPGAGGLLIQLIVGGVAGLAVVIKLRWRSIKARFGSGEDPEKAHQSEDPNVE